MKKNTFFVVAALAATALLVGPPSIAQPGAQAHRGEGVRKMADALGLTDAQKAQMKTIAQDARAQIKALRTPGTPSADTQAKIKAIRKSTREQMLTVLTPAQKQQLEQLRRQRKDR